MKPNFHESEQKSLDIIEHSSNAEIEATKTTDEKLKSSDKSEKSISLTLKSSKLPLTLSQLTVIGGVIVAIIATFFLVTRGNDFCFLSICNDLPFQNPIAYSFWSAIGGLGAYGILALLGVSAPIAIVGGLVAWLLMQISLH